MGRGNNNSIFDTSHLGRDLKVRSLRSGAVTLGSQGLSFLIQIGATMILARLLTPQDYGMISMVAALTGFAKIFSDFGLSTATIQHADIDHQQVSNLFWVNVGLGALLAIVIAMLSPAVAWFYKTPQLLWVTAVLALNFFITGLAIQHQAILARQMRFLSIAKVQILSSLVGLAVAVFMALHGFRYWALVLNTMVSSASCVVGVWIVSGWWPCLPRRNSGVGALLNFGSDIAGFNIVNYFSRNLDNILIGRYYGSIALGLYSKAYQLLMLPITNLRQPLNKVALPALSRLQHEPRRYRTYYIKFISALAFVSMPLVVFMGIYSDNLIRLVLGQHWMGASDIFQILAVAALIQPVGTTRGLVLLSNGKSRKYLWWGVCHAIITIFSFCVGLPWGAKGVAMAYAIANYLILYPSLVFVFKSTPVHVNDFFVAIYKPLTASFAMAGAGLLLQRSLLGTKDVYVLPICFLVSLLVYLIALVLVSGGTEDLREYYSYGRFALAKKSGG